MPGARKYLTKYLHRKSYILQEIFVVLTYTHGIPCTVFNILFIQKRFASRDYTGSFIFVTYTRNLHFWILLLYRKKNIYGYNWELYTSGYLLRKEIYIITTCSETRNLVDQYSRAGSGYPARGIKFNAFARFSRILKMSLFHCSYFIKQSPIEMVFQAG